MMKNKTKAKSKRLDFMLSFIGKPKKFVDVGCDHGFIAAEISKKAKRVVATDISEKCLQKAQKNAEKMGLAQKIEFVACDGLTGVLGEFDACLIAGMGGEEIVKIISSCPKNVKVANFYLQPATKVLYLKRWLKQNDFKIVKDSVVSDKNIFYNIFKVKKGREKKSEFDLFFGKQNFKKPSLDFKNYVNKIFEKLSNYSEKGSSEILIEELNLFKEANRRLKNDTKH